MGFGAGKFDYKEVVNAIEQDCVNVQAVDMTAVMKDHLGEFFGTVDAIIDGCIADNKSSWQRIESTARCGVVEECKGQTIANKEGQHVNVNACIAKALNDTCAKQSRELLGRFKSMAFLRCASPSMLKVLPDVEVEDRNYLYVGRSYAFLFQPEGSSVTLYVGLVASLVSQVKNSSKVLRTYLGVPRSDTNAIYHCHFYAAVKCNGREGGVTLDAVSSDDKPIYYRVAESSGGSLQLSDESESEDERLLEEEEEVDKVRAKRTKESASNVKDEVDVHWFASKDSCKAVLGSKEDHKILFELWKQYVR